MIDPSHPAQIGLVLGGGGARGLAHAGVLKVLDREGIPISFIAGTSMGGLIGTAYASGVPARAIEAELIDLSRRSRLIQLADWLPSLTGLFSGNRLQDYFAKWFGVDRTFGELACPLALTATDLRSGREVILDAGSVIQAMRATMSIPGIYQAVQVGQKRLVDGGVLNNVPADVARRMGAQRLIAVDVLPSFDKNRPDAPVVEPQLMPPMFPPVARDIWHTIFLSISALTAYRLAEAKPEVLLRPALPQDVTLLFGFTRADELIALGEQAAEAALPTIRHMLATVADHDDAQRPAIDERVADLTKGTEPDPSEWPQP
ncbi:MAG: patatin-like phospholipase family protein [Bacteroidota bacterium]